VGEVALDEEHKTYSVSFTDSQGAVRTIDWALASTAESRQMLAKHAQLKDRLQPPFYIEYAAKTAKAEAEEEAEEAASEEGVAADAGGARDCGGGETGEARRADRARSGGEEDGARGLRIRVEQGKKEYQVQRYKGLGR